MKPKTLLTYVSRMIVVLLLLTPVGPALGQEPGPGNEKAIATAQPELPDEGEEVEGEGLPNEEELILAQPPYTMNYQGYLTDSSGSPSNGTYQMVFRLYDDAAVGNIEWGPETHAGVQVTNGLFQVTLGETVTLYPNDFDEALWLAAVVDGTPVSPRQPLHAVPYAFGLVPGAEVQGDPEATDYALYVNNSGTGSTDRGIYVYGNDEGIHAVGAIGPGVYADRAGDAVYAIYNSDVTYSDEGYAGPDTYVWLPAMSAVLKYDDTNEAHLEVLTFGEVRIEADDSGAVDVEIPIQIEHPYGRSYLVRSATVYYKVDSDCYITDGWILGRDYSSTSDLTIGHNSTDGTSASFASYTIDATDHNTVTSTQAPTNLQIRIYMANANGDAYLYGVRLRLDSDY